MLAGGAHCMIHPFGVTGFNLLTALSTRNENPPRASRPFDRNRDGFVLGEGAGMVILETLEHATRAARDHDPRPRSSATARPPTPSASPTAPGRAGRDRRHDRGPAPTRSSPPPTSTTSTPTARAPRSTTASRPWRSSRSSATCAKKVPVSSHQEHDGPPDRRRRRGRGDPLRAGDPRRGPAADDQLRDTPTPSATSTTSPTSARKARVDVALSQQLRLRRPERHDHREALRRLTIAKRTGAALSDSRVRSSQLFPLPPVCPRRGTYRRSWVSVLFRTVGRRMRRFGRADESRVAPPCAPRDSLGPHRRFTMMTPRPQTRRALHARRDPDRRDHPRHPGVDRDPALRQRQRPGQAQLAGQHAAVPAVAGRVVHAAARRQGPAARRLPTGRPDRQSTYSGKTLGPYLTFDPGQPAQRLLRRSDRHGGPAGGDAIGGSNIGFVYNSRTASSGRPTTPATGVQRD